jgi:predicted MarR family transcription regulator
MLETTDPSTTRGTHPIVSSAHLANGASPALSELEFSLTLAGVAYQRWMVRCASAAGAQLTALEVLIMHTVRHRDRPKRIADITLVLDIEDTHLATYALRKLQTAGLIKASRVGKEKMVAPTKEGIAFCDRYRDIREELLVGTARGQGPSEETVSELARQMRLLSGSYNQAARAAATL